MWTLMGTPNSTLSEQTWNQSHSPVWKKISEMNINNSTFFSCLTLAIRAGNSYSLIALVVISMMYDESV